MSLDALARQRIVVEALDRPRSNYAAIAASAGISTTTIYRWIRAYAEAGLPGLEARWGAKRGTTMSPALCELLRGQWLSPQQPSVTTLYHRAISWAAQLGQPAPSLGTVRRYLATIPPAVGIHDRHGPRAWRAAAEPKTVRDWRAVGVGEIWIGDHRRLDVLVRLSDAPDAPRLRPWLTAWMDGRSRVAIGVHLDVVPSSHTIALALRSGILAYGVPREIYVDNGRDYRSAYLRGKQTTSRVDFDESLQRVVSPGVLTDLGITCRHATAYQPWSKPIEAWFSHVCSAWERTLPGWTGPDAQRRPEKLSREIRRNELWTLATLRAALVARIEEYHATPSVTLGATPISLWNDVVRAIPEARALDLLLLRHRRSRVSAHGVQAFGLRGRPRYYWDDALALYIGRSVDVRYDPADLSVLYIYSEQSLLCVAAAVTPHAHGSTESEVAAHVRRQRAARETIKNYRAARQTVFQAIPEPAVPLAVNDTPRPPTGPTARHHTPADFTARRLAAERRDATSGATILALPPPASAPTAARPTTGPRGGDTTPARSVSPPTPTGADTDLGPLGWLEEGERL